jgi:hypothetical protein
LNAHPVFFHVLVAQLDRRRCRRLLYDVRQFVGEQFFAGCAVGTVLASPKHDVMADGEQVQNLRMLEPGPFYGFGPAFDVQEPRLVRVGLVKTSHPEPGRVVLRNRHAALTSVPDGVEIHCHIHRQPARERQHTIGRSRHDG